MVKINLELPEGYLNEEERDGFLVSHEQKEIWAVELDLLNEFMRVCKKYDLKYFADAGTMLGAIRHGGMIPWDDDIDIIMIREEYIKLEKIAPKEFQYPYFWQTERTDPGSMRGHAQLRNSETTGIRKSELEKKYTFNQGIFIDIFPLDYIPEDLSEREIFFSDIKKWYEKALHNTYFTSRYKEQGKGIKKILRRWYHIYRIKFAKKNRAYEKFEKAMKKYDNQQSKKIGRLFFEETLDIFIWESKWLKGSKEMPFEMFQIPVLNSCNEILNYIYGDWQTPVIGSSIHGGIFFDTNKSYKQYIE